MEPDPPYFTIVYPKSKTKSYMKILCISLLIYGIFMHFAASEEVLFDTQKSSTESLPIPQHRHIFHTYDHLLPADEVNDDDNSDLENQVWSKKFPSHEELFKSRFWSNLEKKKNPAIAQSTTIFIEDTNTTYFFGESEYQHIENDTPSDKNTGKQARPIELIEVKFGQMATKTKAFPISGCMSMKGESTTIQQLKQRSLRLSIPQNLFINPEVFGIGASIGAGARALSLFKTKTTGIICRSEPGEKVQIFKREKFAYFRDIKMRRVLYQKGKKRLMNKKVVKAIKTEKWKNIYTSLKYKKLGVVFLDLSSGERPYCESRKEKLQCGNDMCLLRIFEEIEREI